MHSSRFLIPVFLLALSAVGGSCDRRTTTVVAPLELPYLVDWCSELVHGSVDVAEVTHVEAVIEILAARHGVLDTYLSGVAQSVAAFRADVPVTDSSRIYDISQTRQALQEARTAQDVVAERLPHVRASNSELFELSQIFLDRLSAALDAVDRGEPGADSSAFMLRYSGLVESYDLWAESAASVIADLNEQVWDF